ncbi:hypothetical protein BH11MYX3_BH11MYX3_29660 [soil metagenome]
MKTALFALITALALPSLAIADDTKTTADKTKAPAKLADEDVKLVAHVHHVNMMEVDMGKLAQQRGGADVKKYGQTLVTDHTASDKDLTAFAKTKGVAKIPTDVPMSDTEKQDMKDGMTKMGELKRMKGAEFDRQFLMMMTTDHDKEIARLDAALPGIKDADLAMKMKDLRPVLQRHADTARELSKQAPTASLGTTPAKN